ncbi:MAG: EamA family transporter, partial [Lapillicoccus sp.]
MTATRIPWQARFVALALIWGASFLLMKIGLESLAPLQIATLRVLSGAVTVLVVGSFLRARLPRERRVWLHLAVSGLFLASLPFTLFPLGEQRVSSALAGIGNATTPLATVGFTLLLIPGDRLGGRKILSVILGFVGVV